MPRLQSGRAPARITLLRCLGRGSWRFVQFFDASALPPEHGDARQRDEEGEEEKRRPAEALGQRAGGWSDWLLALSGGIYVPVEIYELTRGVSWIKVAALLLNAAVVAYMCYMLWVSRNKGRNG